MTEPLDKNRRWRLKNPEKVKAQLQRRMEKIRACPELAAEVRAKQRARYRARLIASGRQPSVRLTDEERAAKKREYDRLYREKNREKLAAHKAKKWKEVYKAQWEERRKNDPEAAQRRREAWRRYEAKRRGTTPEAVAQRKAGRAAALAARAPELMARAAKRAEADLRSAELIACVMARLGPNATPEQIALELNRERERRRKRVRPYVAKSALSPEETAKLAAAREAAKAEKDAARAERERQRAEAKAAKEAAREQEKKLKAMQAKEARRKQLGLTEQTRVARAPAQPAPKRRVAQFRKMGRIEALGKWSGW